jgi:hypothetical protein
MIHLRAESWSRSRKIAFATIVCGLAWAAAPAAAQQTTGTPRSPSATTTIPGNQLPPPPPPFGGVIKEQAKDSTPWVATDGRAAKARAERAADHDR